MKKNAINPFSDPASLEFFSERNDCSLFVFGSSSKKRPHTLTLGRTFGHKILDMLCVPPFPYPVPGPAVGVHR